MDMDFQPSVAIVIGILCIVFSVTFIYFFYDKFHHRVVSPNHQQIEGGLVRSVSCLSGMDKTVVESLPFFRFSSLKGSREGLECSVCLSKFEDVEILRLLPKCKHMFHIDCVDKWLERHSCCPLCRHKVSADDMSSVTYSNSLRFLWNNSGAQEDLNMELFVQREGEHRGFSRFSIGNSFRKFHKGKKQEELLIQESAVHKHNHMIIVSHLVLKHRWSNVNSSDLLFLNSEMLNANSSNRFSALDSNPEQGTKTQEIKGAHVMNIQEAMEKKREHEYSVLSPGDKRSLSELTLHPRFREFDAKNRTIELLPKNNPREERMRRLWLPIARRTVQWFADRAKSTPGSSGLTETKLDSDILEQPHCTRDSLNV